MLNNIREISSFIPKKSDVFLFDTNALIKIFYPAMGVSNSKPYIALYQKIKAIKATLLISSIQISEFVNRCIRFQFELYKKSHPNVTSFKEHYRNTQDYLDCMEAILEIIESDILSDFKRINDNFDTMDTDKLLLHNFAYDFNDAFIAEISRLQNCILVTDDGDYANYLQNLNILTNNRILLMFRKNK